MINWKDLVVTEEGTPFKHSLLEYVNTHVHALNHALICDGRIVAWSGYFISAPGENPDWDTPKVSVDWTGFEEALNETNR